MHATLNTIVIQEGPSRRQARIDQKGKLMSRTQPLMLLLATIVGFVVPSVVRATPSPLTPSGVVHDDALSVVYDPATGHLSAMSPDGSPLSALELKSASKMFTSECDNLGGVFDVCTDAKVFKLTTAGFEDVDFGAVLPTDVSGQSLLDDLAVDGATFGGGFETGSGMYLVHPDFVVPEPAAFALFGLGAMLMGATRRRLRT